MLREMMNKVERDLKNKISFLESKGDTHELEKAKRVLEKFLICKAS